MLKLETKAVSGASWQILCAQANKNKTAYFVHLS